MVGFAFVLVYFIFRINFKYPLINELIIMNLLKSFNGNKQIIDFNYSFTSCRVIFIMFIN